MRILIKKKTVGVDAFIVCYHVTCYVCNRSGDLTRNMMQYPEPALLEWARKGSAYPLITDEDIREDIIASCLGVYDREVTETVCLVA